MRFTQRTYSVTTNTFLMLGVASAFGFDRTDHMAWLVLGGSAAIGAIATYFLHHWKAKPDAESTTSAVFPANLLTVDPWVTQVETHGAPMLAPIERVARGSYGKTREWESVDFLYLSSGYGHSKPADPIELVSEIIKRLQATSKRNVYELVIAKDGSMRLKFDKDDEEPQTSRLSQRNTGELFKTIH